MNDFDRAFDRLIGSEGGYVNDPNDPGGETNWGISKRSYPNVDIKNLTREQAATIYYRDFWNRIHADAMPFALAFQTFDFAVNSGIETAVRYLQKALGVADDGYWGPVTMQAVASADVDYAVMRVNAYRLIYMTKLSGWGNFGRGWARRIATNLLSGADDN